MIPFDEAFQTVMSSVRQVSAERVDIDSVLNRILAEDIESDVDMPPFNKAAMDGYACRREDLTNELSVIETIPAGYVPKKPIGRNECAKIMTGAMVPEGADCVIMVELTENPTEGTVSFVGKSTSGNICFKGEDVREGEVVLRKGEKIMPQHIALLAAFGCVRPAVARRPKVGIIATGNELVQPVVEPDPSQIRDSNSYQLFGQVAHIGGIPLYYGIAGDSEGAIDEVLKRATAENDVVLISGGVSMGDLDLVPDVLKKNGIELIIEKIAIKPGKPTIFGKSDSVFCFGLPGNPVSAFVIFEILVKPFLYKMMGHDYRPPNILMPLGKTISRKRADRESWTPVVLTHVGAVMPVEYHGAAHSRALCPASGLISIPIGVTEIPKGTKVRVRQI